MPNLTGYAPLDVAIGLAFVYLLFSVLCMAVQEGIAAALDLRAKTLEEGLRNLLEDDGNSGERGAPTAVPAVTDPPAPDGGPLISREPRREDDLTDRVLGHGLVRTLYKGRKEKPGSQQKLEADKRQSEGGKRRPKWGKRQRRGPSYISPSIFALSLLDIVAPGKNRDPIDEVSKQIAVAPIPAGVKDALLGLTTGAAKDRDHLRALVEDWYDHAMERVSGWYKRKVQLWICGLSLLVAVGLNVNTISIGERLAKDNVLRAAVVAQAQSTSVKPESAGAASAAPPAATTGAKAETPKERAKLAVGEIDKLDKLGLPIGWNKKPGDPARAELDSLSGVAHAVGGWLLTFIALSLGAPFWFGTLTKLTSLRSSGEAPKTK